LLGNNFWFLDWSKTRGCGYPPIFKFGDWNARHVQRRYVVPADAGIALHRRILEKAILLFIFLAMYMYTMGELLKAFLNRPITVDE